jgi:hypothetical protein
MNAVSTQEKTCCKFLYRGMYNKRCIINSVVDISRVFLHL